MRGARPAVAAWAVLLLLVAAEVAVGLLKPGRAGIPLLLVLSAGSAGLVGFAFMRLRRSSGLAKGFAFAAVVWLAILLGLTSVDRYTRTDYPMPVSRVP